MWGYTADGVHHENFHPNPEAGEVSGVAGWYSANTDRGFVSVGDYGDPVLTYVANCGDGCANVDKEMLEWVKVDEVGKNGEGEWAAVQLIGTNNTWTTTVPETLAPGKYVFRHEIISLAGTQHYPSCINIEITGDGTDEREGVIGTELYTEDDAANPVEEYVILGPKLYTPGPSPSTSAGDVDPIATSTISAQSAAPTGVGVSSSAATLSSTSDLETSVAPSTAPISSGVSNATATPSEASSSSTAPSTTSGVGPVTTDDTPLSTTESCFSADHPFADSLRL